MAITLAGRTSGASATSLLVIARRLLALTEGSALCRTMTSGFRLVCDVTTTACYISFEVGTDNFAASAAKFAEISLAALAAVLLVGLIFKHLEGSLALACVCALST